MTPTGTNAAVLGGSVSGLAAADGLSAIDDIEAVRVFERQTYDEKRVACGEAINDASLVPLPKTPENGFQNDVEGYQIRVYGSTDRDPDAAPLGVSNLRCDPGYVCDRNVVERRWAESLSEDGVRFETGLSVTAEDYRAIVDEYDYVVDATGYPSLSSKVRGESDAYTGGIVALNATVEGDFGAYVDRPRIFFEGYVGYAWSFPKSERRANVGIGWVDDHRPDDYVAALAAAAERNGFPMPDRADLNVATIPCGPSLHPDRLVPEDGVFLVGDAAGIANRYQGEGICQGIRSAYGLCDCIAEGEAAAYPTRLYDAMRPEFRLGRLMRGVWTEHEDPALLAAVLDAVEGESVEAVTRRPATVARRLLRRPGVAARLLADRGMLRRVVDAYRDSWAYADGRSASA